MSENHRILINKPKRLSGDLSIYGKQLDTASCFFAYLRQSFEAKGTNGLDITHTLVNTHIQEASANVGKRRDDIRCYRFSAFWLRSKCSICSYQLNI